MFLRALVLVAFATVVSAGVGGKSSVKAVAKYTVEDDADGFGYMIKLDGSESERECANAGWYVKVAGEWVKLAFRMFADYEVGEHSAIYKFRLTIWDPETADRIDHDYVDVEIKGTIVKPPPKGDVKADADIIKVVETENGHTIHLTGKDSKNCQDYVWEYRSKKEFIAIADKESTTYEVLKAGKHKFKLVCINDSINKKDVDFTWVTISKCKDPKFPKNKKSCKKNPNQKRCDPCKKVDVKAKAEVVDVPRTKKGEFIIQLTANASRDCMTYQWERVIEKQPNEKLGKKMTQEYTVTKKGMYKFKVTCQNTDCQDSDSDVVVTDCVATYNPNPCKDIEPVAAAEVRKVEKEKGEWTIFLSAEGSQSCSDYEWELVRGKGNIKIGEGEKIKYKTSDFGKYSFKVTCTHKKCQKSDEEFTKTKIEDPCDRVDPEATAVVKRVEKDGKQWVISLSAEGSKKCSSYKWILVGKKENEVVGEGEKMKYKTDKPGSYKFKVKCENKNCDKSDGEYTETKIENPCKKIEPVAEAVVKSVQKVKGDWVISLSADGSKKCSSYKWSLVGEGKIGEGSELKYTTSKFGIFKFKVTCTNQKCDKTDSDVTETFIENPCKKIEAEAVAEVTKVQRKIDGCVISLTAAASKKCDSFTWYRVNGNGDNIETLGEGVDQAYNAGKKGNYAFRVKCKNDKCKDSDSDIIETECVPRVNPCKDVDSVAKASIKNVEKISGEWVISLSSGGSQYCETYEWQLVKSSGNENIGSGPNKKYTTSKYGSFSFKLICKHTKCKDSAVDFTQTSIKNPCNAVVPDAVASSTYKDAGVEKYLITLSSTGSQQCNKFQWELVRDGDDEIIGDDASINYKVTASGSYKFKLTCFSKCKKNDVAFTQIFIVNNNPCKGVNPEAAAKVTGVQKTGTNWMIYLSAAGSADCDTYSWELVKSGGNVNIGNGKTQSYSASTFGFYKFLVKCQNVDCKKTDTDVTETSIPDPCKNIKADANGVVESVKKISGSEWKITLSAAKSEDCQTYQWSRFLSANKSEKLGNDVKQTYTATRKGSYIFEVTCENKKCQSKDSDIAQTKCLNTY